MENQQTALSNGSRDEVCESSDIKYFGLTVEQEIAYSLKPTEFVQNREKALKEFIRKHYDTVKKNNIVESNYCSHFEVTPNIVIFTSYTPFKKYESVVSLKNIDANARSLKFKLGENDAFKISYISDVAPGMLFSFKVEFYPKSCENYEQDLQIFSENKSFTLPIRCINDEIILDIQDEITISETPIYMKSEKSITIKNIGKYENKFQVVLKPPFYANSRINMLKQGEIMEIKVTFLPVKSTTYEGYMIINYENGVSTHTKIRGKGIVADVLIKDREVVAEDICINESKEISIFIKNQSFFLLTCKLIKYHVYECKYENLSADIRQATFEVADRIVEKTFITENELEDDNIVENELYKNEEDCEYEDDYSSSICHSVQTGGSILDEGEDAEVSKNYAEEMNLEDYGSDSSAHYPHPCDLSFYLDEDRAKLSKIVKVYPKCKKLYNDTDTPITISIRPSFASFFKIILFLFIKGYKKEEKIVVYLKSIAPEIIIPNVIHKIDNILVNMKKLLSFDLINNSKYDIHVKIEKINDEYNEFEIIPYNFVLVKNSRYILKMVYIPQINGTRKNDFIIHQKYTNVKRSLCVLSECHLPDIQFDVQKINFNHVSYNFEYEKSIHIYNKSDLILHYTIKIPEELKNEIKIIESSNILKNYEKKKISIKFCPNVIKTYDYNIHFFLNEIKTYKKILPFFGICPKPKVTCEPLFLNIEPMIIDKDYEQQFRIINQSEVIDVKYELILDEKINDICILNVSEREGIIEKKNFKLINITLKSKIIGYILIVIKIKIFGCEDFLFLNIKAHCTCPTIKINPSIIDFEKCNCLDVKEKIIEIRNESPINTFINLSNTLSIFSFSQNNFYIEPNESIFIHIYARCLETIAYSDVLHVGVHRKEEILIPIKAQGAGSPILINEHCINFEVVYTNKKYFHELIIFNKGTNERSIYFLFESEKKRKKNSECAQIFNVTPRNLSIKGGSEMVCILSGLNCKEEKCEDVLYIYEDAVNKKKVSNSFKKIKIEAVFVYPEVEIRGIAPFVYDFHEQREATEGAVTGALEERVIYMKDLGKLMQQVEVTNLQSSNIKLTLSTNEPFYVESDVIELMGKEKKKISIFFDIDYMNNKMNNTYKESLIVNFFENSKRQKYELTGKTIYPNVVINKNYIDFQYILKNIFSQEIVEIKNVCNFKIYFKWFFEENNTYRNFNEVFNVSPSKGYLLPLEKKVITVTYNSINENYYNINILCHIKNGPIYPLKLIAGYSDIKYTISKTQLNYNTHYKYIGEDFITINNTGKIKLFIEVICNIRLPSLLYTNVNNFFIEPNNSKDIIFYFIPGIPQNISENILIKICNFEEVKIRLNSSNFCSILHLNVDVDVDMDVDTDTDAEADAEMDAISHISWFPPPKLTSCLSTNKNELSDGEIPSEEAEPCEQPYAGKKKDKLKCIDSLINSTLFFADEDTYYENQRIILIKKLRKMYFTIFSSLRRCIEEILNLYYQPSNGSGEGGCSEGTTMEAGVNGKRQAEEWQLEGEQLEGDKLEGEQLEGDKLEGDKLEGEKLEGDKLEGEQLEEERHENHFNANEMDSSRNSKGKYDLLRILKNYCSKNSDCIFFSDFLKSLILNQKDDAYILNSFSRLKKLVNFEKLSCHNYLSNEHILKYLKRVILESNIELKGVSLNLGNLVINEKKERNIKIKNVSNDKVMLSCRLKENETKDIQINYDHNNNINKNDFINFKIIIQKNSEKEKKFLQNIYIYLNDNNYYTINIRYNYIIPDIILYYKQLYFEKIEIKKCLCKINRLINIKNVDIKFKIKNIIFYNKKLKYYHMKKKKQIFIYPIKGIIKNNSYSDIKIFFEPSNVYKNAKVSIEIFIYNSNFIKTIDLYLNSVKDIVHVNPSDIIVKPLLLNCGEVHKIIKINNLNNYCKHLYIYKLDKSFKYLENFIYDLLTIHKHIYVEKNDEKDIFYINLVHYLIDLYKNKIEIIKQVHKENITKNCHIGISQLKNEKNEGGNCIIPHDECVEEERLNNKGCNDKNDVHLGEHGQEEGKKTKLKESERKGKTKLKESKRGGKTKLKEGGIGEKGKEEGGNVKTEKGKKDKLKHKKEKNIDPSADNIHEEKYILVKSDIYTEEERKDIQNLENKITMLEEIIRKNEIKYNYFEEYVKLVKIKKKAKDNYLVICPKYMNHKKVGTYLLKNSIFNYSKKGRVTYNNTEYENTILTVNKIINWCKEIVEKENYPVNVKSSFVRYIIHAKSINKNVYSYSKLDTSTILRSEKVESIECEKCYEGTWDRFTHYYIGEVLNMGRKGRGENVEMEETLLEVGAHRHGDNEKEEMENVGRDIRETIKYKGILGGKTNYENEHSTFSRKKMRDDTNGRKLLEMYQNKKNNKLGVKSVKAKIDNKHVTYTDKKQNRNINDKREKHEGECTFDEKTFFNKYNMKYEFEYVNHFFYFSLLNDEIFMNDVRSFLKFIISDKKKSKNENSTKRKNNFLSLFENILRKILLAPSYVNGVVFFFKKNDYISAEHFFSIFLKVILDENVHIVYFNPVQNYDEFFHVPNRVGGKKESSTLKNTTGFESGGEEKKSDTIAEKKNGMSQAKTDEPLDSQRIKHFYEKLAKKYHEKIEKKLKEKEQVEKIIESLNEDVHAGAITSMGGMVESDDRKKVPDMEVKEYEFGNIMVSHKADGEQSESALEDRIYVSNLDSTVQNSETLSYVQNGKKERSKNESGRYYLGDNQNDAYSTVEKLYNKIVICKEGKKLNRQIINELSTQCCRRNEHIDCQIVKYSKRVNKINNYIKTKSYLDYVSFYRDMKILLCNLLYETLKKGNHSLSSSMHPLDEDYIVENSQKEEGKGKNRFLKRVDIQLSCNFVEKINEQEMESVDEDINGNDDTRLHAEKKDLPYCSNEAEKNTIKIEFNKRRINSNENTTLSINKMHSIHKYDVNKKEENEKTIISKNDELMMYLKQCFVQINFLYFFINEDTNFKIKNFLNYVSNFVKEKYSGIRTCAYFFDMPNSKFYDTFNLRCFLKSRKNLENWENQLYVNNEEEEMVGEDIQKGNDKAGEAIPREMEQNHYQASVEEMQNEQKKTKDDNFQNGMRADGKDKKKKKKKKDKGKETGANENEKEEADVNAKEAKAKEEEHENRNKSGKKGKRHKQKEKRKKNEVEVKEMMEEEKKGEEQEHETKRAESNRSTKNGRDHRKEHNIETSKEESGKKKKRKDVGEKVKGKKKNAYDEIKEDKHAKGEETSNDANAEGAPIGAMAEDESDVISKNVEGKENSGKNTIIYQAKGKIRSSGEKEVTEEIHHEKLEKRKHEIKDEYDYMFYDLRNSYDKKELIDREKNRGHHIMEFLQIDTSYDKKDEIRYKNITNIMLEKNNCTEISIKINTCKIVKLKRKICFIDILGNYVFLSIHILIDKPKIYSNPYFIFSNNVSIFPSKRNCFVLSKKAYNFNKVLIGRNVHIFRDIVENELKEECDEQVTEFLKKMEGTNLSKIKMVRNMGKKNCILLNASISGEKEKSKSKHIDMIRKIDICKYLYKHVQVLNLYNSSHFDCFVQISFENMLHNVENKNRTYREENHVENYLTHNDFYVYPNNFFILSMKCKKIIILFLPKNSCSFSEKLMLSIYSIQNEVLNANNKKAVCLKNDKTDILSTIKKKSTILSNENLFSNNIDLSNKTIDNCVYDIFSLCLEGEGIKCSLKIDKSYLNFHKVLLNTIQKKAVELKNNSYCDLLWFVDSHELGNDSPVQVCPLKGILQKNEKKMITITINTNSVHVIRSDIKINYVEKNLSKSDKMKNVYSSSLIVEAEVCKSFTQIEFEIIDGGEDRCIEEKVDDKVIFPVKGKNFMKKKLNKSNFSKGIDPSKSKYMQPRGSSEDTVTISDINFRHVQVNEMKTCLFKIKNTGKVTTFYVIDLNDDAFLNFISIDKISDSINSNETKNVRLKLKSEKKIKFQNIPLLIHMYDIENNYIQSYKYLLSVHFDYNYLKIIPPILNYNSVEVKKEEQKFFKIMNEGQFDFTYDIKLLKGKVKNRGNINRDQGNNDRNEKIVIYDNSLQVKQGNRHNEMEEIPFIISPATGLVKSKEEKTITVLFNSAEEKDYKFIYIVQVDNIIPHGRTNERQKNAQRDNETSEKYKEIVKIFASSVKPCISCDIENIFEEIFVLKKVENYRNFLDHFLCKNSYYNVDNNTLYYKHSYVNECINERIKISNTSDVSAHVKIDIREIDFSTYKSKKGRERVTEREVERGREVEAEKENEKKKSIASDIPKPIEYGIRIEEYNEVKSRWNYWDDRERNAHLYGATSSSASVVSTSAVITRYQHKYVDICFYSRQIASKKFLVNIHLAKPLSVLCFSFYINVEFFLPSINMIMEPSLQKLQREEKIFDLGNIHLNSVISFKIKLKNCFKHPVFVKVFYEHFNSLFGHMDDYEMENKEKNDGRKVKGSLITNEGEKKKKENADNERSSVLKMKGDYEEDGSKDGNEQIGEGYDRRARGGDAAAKESTSKEDTLKDPLEYLAEGHDRISHNDPASSQFCAQERKDLYSISNNALFNNETDKMMLKKKGNVTYVSYENVEDVVYKEKTKKIQMSHLGYFYYIGNSNYILKENDSVYFKIKVDKKKIENEIRRRRKRKQSHDCGENIFEGREEENDMGVQSIHKFSVQDDTNKKRHSYGTYKTDYDDELDYKRKSNKNNRKKKEFNNKRDEDGIEESIMKNTKNISAHFQEEKEVLGSINVKVLNNNYEFYNLKFLGNIIESKNYWNLDMLKREMKHIYKNENMYIFKNHINFDLLPVNYNHVFKVYYTNENNFSVYFNLELDKKMKSVLDVKPLNGLIPPRSSFLFYLHLDLKEPIILTKKKISCTFSLHPFHKKNGKMKDGHGDMYDDSLYLSLTSEEVKVSYNKKKIIFKNIPFFNYSKNELVLENLSHVILHAELNIVPVNGLEDLSSVYSFFPFKEKDIISLLNKTGAEMLSKESTMKNETNYVDSEYLIRKEMKNMNNETHVDEKEEQKNDTQNGDTEENNFNTGREVENLKVNKPIDEFYLTRYDFNASDFGDSNTNREENSNDNIKNNETNKCEILKRNIMQRKAIKKYITIRGKCTKKLCVYCFHHVFKKAFEAEMHIKIMFYTDIVIPIKMTFENYEQRNVFLLTNFRYDEITEKKDKIKMEKKNKIEVISRGILHRTDHMMYMLNISSESVEYLLEKVYEVNECEEEKSTSLLRSSRGAPSCSTTNAIECANYRGFIQRNSVSPIKFFLNTLNLHNYRGSYNLLVNNKKEEHVEFELRVIEPLTFFNTSSVHINNLILGKRYCFIFYIINFDLMDVHFEFDKNSYNSFNSKKETIKIIPFKGTAKSCYRKGKLVYPHICKSNPAHEISTWEKNDIKNTTNLVTVCPEAMRFAEGGSIHNDCLDCGNRVVPHYAMPNNLKKKRREKKKMKVKMNCSDCTGCRDNCGACRSNCSSYDDSGSSVSTLSKGSQSSSPVSSFKSKKGDRNEKKNDLLLRTKGRKENFDVNSVEKWEYIDTSCDSDSESSSCISENNYDNVDTNCKNKFILINDYLKGICSNNSSKFKKDIKNVLGKGRSKKIKLLFKPHLEQFYNFNLLCNVNEKEEPLKLNFKTKVSKINMNCYVDTFDKEKIILNFDNPILNRAKKIKNDMVNTYNIIDFKETLIGKKKVSNIVIENLCDFDLVYKFYLQKKDKNIYIKCSDRHITKSSSVIISVEYTPFINEIYENHLTINIADYYLINFKITAVATNLLINFSFHNYDFGNVLLFPVLDKNVRMIDMLAEKRYNDGFSSSDSSISSLISNYKTNQRNRKKQMELEEKENQENSPKRDKTKDAGEKKRRKRDKKRGKHKKEDEKGAAKEGEEKGAAKVEKEDKFQGSEKRGEFAQSKVERDESGKYGVHEEDTKKDTKNCKINFASTVMSKVKGIKEKEEGVWHDADTPSEEENTNTVETKLFICNNNDEDCYIEYELNESCLKIINMSQRIYLKRKSKICLFVLFKPNEEKKYSYKIPFKINNDREKIIYINFTGSATNFKLPFSCNNSNDIHFKDIHVDKESINKFTLHNKNMEDISFNILNYAYLGRHYLTFVNFDNGILHNLKKKEKRTFEVKFSPEKYLNVYIPVYINVYYKEKCIPYYLTSIKLNSMCYKVILKECLLTFNKIEKQKDIPNNENSNEIEQVKEKLFKCSTKKDSIRCQKIQLHNTGDMNAQFQINYPHKYEKFLFFYPKKGIIFSFNLTSIYIFVDTYFITKDVYINDVSVELFPQFNKINSKLFFNIFINSCNNTSKCRSVYGENIRTIAPLKCEGGEQTSDLGKGKNWSEKERGDPPHEGNKECNNAGTETKNEEQGINVFSLKNETIITFETDVRKAVIKTVEIYNNTESDFKMKYKFLSNENNFFSVIKYEDIIKPNRDGIFKITYNPLFIQKEKKNSNNYHKTLCERYLKYCSKIHHISKLIIYHPNDVVRNYTLLGYSNNAIYEKKITYNFKSKILNTSSLRIKNWLNENQHLLLSVRRCDHNLNTLKDDLFFFYVQNKFDLCNKEEKKLSFKAISLREGIYYVMLTFSNEKYEDVYRILLQFEITKGDYLLIKNIRANKKEIIKEPICIFNPLDENIKVEAIFDYKYIFFEKSIILEKKKNNNVNIYFCIIKNEVDKNISISFNNKTIGTYNFKFILNVHMNDFEDNFYFNTDLGSVQINEISFTNVCNQKINYDVLIEDYDEKNKNSKHIFQCIDKTVNAKCIDTNFFLQNGTLNNLSDKINLTIKYNPLDIKTNKAILKLVSKEGIVYKGLMIGKSVAPKPKGPIFCSSQKATLIAFTNPFLQSKQFFLQSDEHFSVPFENTKVEARQTIQIPVKCKATSGVTGKLLIKSEDDVVWMYYLTGQ
ncbi:conserved Plasmodium protein, unknown function [Plasmodium ovale]|uniref:HYDIN/VesB/CFA65-like Ig-like domain-containing protein n=1 Tax=Plasmodium ovale TaxID=36330 RepID=A0A1D3TLJ4_PLAOA|nr:conserved Plasmodium protein, unknown function [Plasmodium ovale]